MTPISTRAFYERSTTSMGDLRARADGLQATIGGRSRLTRSSNDPVAASRLRSLAQAAAVQTVNSANADRAAADLTLADGALGSFADSIGRARELAMQAASGTLTDTQRSALGSELSQIHAHMLALANTRDGSGHALFGGDASGPAYVTDANGAASYAGTATSGQLDLGDGASVTRSLTGPEFLTVMVNGTATDIMAVVKQVAEGVMGPGGQAAAQSALSAFDAGTSAVATAQAVVGSRLSWTDMAVQRQVKMSELRESEAFDLNGGDLATNIIDLQHMMVVLQASQASFAKLSSLSLFDVLR
jgi:flagellar hook-associated protein 3 FlgL